MRNGARETALILALLGLCPLAAALVGREPGAPLQRTAWLLDAERSLGIAVEPALHGWALERPWLLTAAGVACIALHVPVAGWVLVWTWWLRRDAFALVRDTFIDTQVMTVAFSLLVPAAPPRLLGGEGFSDTLTGVWGREFADSTHTLQSPFAAMPSGHVAAFALIVGATFATIGDRRWLRAFGWSYPPLVVGLTVMTANHLLLDAVGAVLVVTIAYAAARRRAGRRTEQSAGGRHRLRPRLATSRS